MEGGRHREGLTIVCLGMGRADTSRFYLWWFSHVGLILIVIFLKFRYRRKIVKSDRLLNSVISI